MTAQVNPDLSQGVMGIIVVLQRSFQGSQGNLALVPVDWERGMVEGYFEGYFGSRDIM